MARKIITSLVDDIDGSDAAETVTFALDEKAFEIDLSAKLREVLAPWVDSARRVAGAAARTRTAPVRGGRADLNAVREWARGQGLKVSDRGRVSATVLEAYTKAH